MSNGVADSVTPAPAMVPGTMKMGATPKQSVCLGVCIFHPQASLGCGTQYPAILYGCVAGGCGYGILRYLNPRFR
jgi:hypothetical protein